jgi:hypothetical protein
LLLVDPSELVETNNRFRWTCGEIHKSVLITRFLNLPYVTTFLKSIFPLKCFHLLASFTIFLFSMFDRTSKYFCFEFRR